jgi:hypothetical protein
MLLRVERDAAAASADRFLQQSVSRSQEVPSIDRAASATVNTQSSSRHAAPATNGLQPGVPAAGAARPTRARQSIVRHDFVDIGSPTVNAPLNGVIVV